jgi:hypothetical protein
MFVSYLLVKSLFLMIYSVLDPGISYERLKADYADDHDLLEALESAKAELEPHYDILYAPSLSTPASSPPPSTFDDTGSPQKIDFRSRYRTQGAAGAVKNELVEYFRLTATLEPLNEDVDPLQWWYMRRKRLPNLYRLVRNVLCIPGELGTSILNLTLSNSYIRPQDLQLPWNGYSLGGETPLVCGGQV